MYKNNIPGIENHIETTLRILDLRPDSPPKAFIKKHKGKKHRYATICTAPSGQRVVFYARLHSNKDAQKKFRQEFLFFHDARNRRNPINNYIPQLYTYSEHTNWEWFVREYVDAPVLGNRYIAEQKLTVRDVPRFVQMFTAMQSLPIQKKNVLHKRRGKLFFKKIAEGNIRATQKQYFSKDYEQMLSFLQSRYAYIEKHSTHLIHGDCHPGNIMKDKKRLLLIDWEIIHPNLRVMDAAYFYVTLSSQPAFRRAFVKSFRQSISWKKEFDELFPVAVLFFSLNQLYVLCREKPRYLTTTQRSRAQKFAITIAKKAIKGYTAIERV